jgi:hypothetical protein
MLNLQMLNPWLTLSLQAARLGWATQSAMMDQFTRVASGVVAGPREVHADVPQTDAPGAARSRPGTGITSEPEPVAVALKTKQHAPRKDAHKAVKNTKKRNRGSKRSLSR